MQKLACGFANRLEQNMSTSMYIPQISDFTTRRAGQTIKHPGEMFSIESKALARLAETFLLNELWKAIEASFSGDSVEGFIGDLPSSISTATEGASKFWTRFHARERNSVSLIRRFGITTFSNTGWGLTGQIIVTPADEIIPWMMHKTRSQGLLVCTNFIFNYEGGWGDHAVMKRDFMLLRLKGELDAA